MLDTLFLNKDSLDPIFSSVPGAEALVGIGMTGNKHYRGAEFQGPLNERRIATVSTLLTQAIAEVETKISSVYSSGDFLFVEFSDSIVVRISKEEGVTVVEHICDDFDGTKNKVFVSGASGTRVSGCKHTNASAVVLSIIRLKSGKDGEEAAKQADGFITRSVFMTEKGFCQVS